MTDEKKIGYAIAYIMDYGNGRQVQINSNLPVGATKAEFDEELDKLRTATDRQKAFVTLRDTEMKLVAEEKLVKSLENDFPQDGIRKNAPLNEQQNLIAKRNELSARKANIEVYQAIIEGAKKETV